MQGVNSNWCELATQRGLLSLYPNFLSNHDPGLSYHERDRPGSNPPGAKKNMLLSLSPTSFQFMYSSASFIVIFLVLTPVILFRDFISSNY